MAVIVFAVQFWPWLSIGIGPADDPGDPLSHSFTVTNDGPVPVFLVQAACYYEDMEFENGARFLNFGVSFQSGPFGVMWPKDQRTIPCHRALRSRNTALIRGKIRILVKHRAWGLYEIAANRVFVSGFRDGKPTPWRPE